MTTVLEATEARRGTSRSSSGTSFGLNLRALYDQVAVNKGFIQYRR